MRVFCLVLFFATTLIVGAHPHLEGPDTGKPMPKSSTPSLKLKVTGVISSGSGHKAILTEGRESRVIAAGDRFGQVEVLRVEPDAVTVLHNGETVRLSLPR